MICQVPPPPLLMHGHKHFCNDLEICHKLKAIKIDFMGLLIS